jgi:hypothetical protein
MEPYIICHMVSSVDGNPPRPDRSNRTMSITEAARRDHEELFPKHVNERIKQ